MDENSPLLKQENVNQSGNTNGKKVKVAEGAILLTITLERVAFYSLAGNLVLFLNKVPYEWKSFNSVNALLYFFGISYLTSFLGGLIADTVLGRFKTLILSLLLYIAGYVFMPLLTGKNEDSGEFLPDICGTGNLTRTSNLVESPFNENCSGLIFGVLTLIAIGSGPFRSAIAPFGADQVKGHGQQASLTFFNWYYWCVNVGSLVAVLGITYVQQHKGFFPGYLASLICLAVAFVVFMCGSCSYVYRMRTGSILKNLFKVLFEACSVCKCCSHRTNEGETDSSIEVPTNCLDYAKYRFGGSFQETTVDDVKKILKIICVFLTLIPYWIVYFQMETTFLVQGLHMNLNLPNQNLNKTINCSAQESTGRADYSRSNKYKPVMVAAWFSAFDIIFVIMLIPVFDRVIYPRFAKAGRPIGFVLRVSIGMVIAAIAMCIAGVVEHFRLESIYRNETTPCCRHLIIQDIGNSEYDAAEMSVFWQIPQYALIGLSEVFASIAALEFAYQMAPKSAKGIIMGLFYMFMGIGSFLGTGSVSMFRGAKLWFGSYDFGNINCRMPCTPEKGSHDFTITEKCHLDFYFFFLAGVEFCGFLLFLLIVYVCGIQKEIKTTNQISQGQQNISSPVKKRLQSPISIQRQNSNDISVS